MATTLDGERLFFFFFLTIEVGGPRRDGSERSVPGLDGVLHIDLGARGREIRQTGILRAFTWSEMRRRIAAISALHDGRIHCLVNASGERFENLRIDEFEPGQIEVSGGGLTLQYRIMYTQLACPECRDARW